MASNAIQPERTDFSVGMRRSLYFHGALLVLILLKSLVFPGKPIPYTPALRVDLVGLPDFLKKDLAKLPKTKGSQEIQEVLEKADQEIKQQVLKTQEKPEPQADPDELVLKPKNAAQEKSKDRHNKLKSSLARIKSLEKIQNDIPEPKVIIKGNTLSQGDSLSSDAKESMESSYFDKVKDRLQENWTLPIWLARQDITAQVLIAIDSRGRIRTFKWVRASGNTQFDELVKRAVYQSVPFPMPPDEIASSILVDGILVGFPL